MHKSKTIKYNSDIRKALISGINQVANCVKVTLGPKGRLVLLGRSFSSGHLTKDGVSVAKEISLPDVFENEGAKLCIDVASKANHEAGDGTTSATVLAQALVNEGMKLVEAGVDPVIIKTGMDEASNTAIDYVNAVKKSIDADSEDVESIASISGNDLEVGANVAKAWKEVGSKGVIALETWKKASTAVEVNPGYGWDSGYLSPYFVTDFQKMRIHWEDETVRVLVTDMRFKTVDDVLPFLENYYKITKDPLLIVADDVEGEALAALALNAHKGIIRVAAVRGPAFGERRKGMLKDIAVLLGAAYISEDLGIEFRNIDPQSCGKASSVVITAEATTIVAKEPETEKEKIERERVFSDHLKGLESQLDSFESEFDKEKLRNRIAKLASGIAVIRVGATTEAELREKRDRYEDAISASKAAIESGIVPGGGVVLLAASNLIKKQLKGKPSPGAEIVANALQEPFKIICSNASVKYHSWLEGFSVVPKKTEEFLGIDANTGNEVNLLSAKIVDPAKVVIKALEAACSIAEMVLLTEAAVVDSPEPEKP